MGKSDLPRKTFQKKLDHYGEDMNPAQMPGPHGTVALVYHVHGIIGNGGFQYLFEGDLPGDPDLVLTRQAYEAIGAVRGSAAFQKAFAILPKSTPPKEIEVRLKIWNSIHSLMDGIKDKQSPDAIYFGSMDETMQLLEK